MNPSGILCNRARNTSKRRNLDACQEPTPVLVLRPIELHAEDDDSGEKGGGGDLVHASLSDCDLQQLLLHEGEAAGIAIPLALDLVAQHVHADALVYARLQHPVFEPVAQAV